jgi:phosphopentomutase
MAGVILPRPFPTYPDGFPDEVIDAFARAIGRGVLGNLRASGTEIIQELGEEHLETGKPIVYTSADSVFQIAAHESVYSADELYQLCRTARGILAGPHAVGRVIARPFRGAPGKFERTAGRHDYSIEPSGITLLDRLMESAIETIGIGKIGDLFAHRGLSREISTSSNAGGAERLIETLQDIASPGFIFLNLVEFDQVYGHRNDCPGYRHALESFDAVLPSIVDRQQGNDLMIITSDHGVDPTTPGTDHTREYSPLLVWGDRIRGGIDLGTRPTFADIGQTLADFFDVPPLSAGTSFLDQLTSKPERES